MIEEFEAAYQYDPNIVSISFSEKQGKFSIDILVSNKQEAVEMHDKLFALRRIYDMSPPKDVLSPIKQNFDIACNEENGTVTLTGNIFNAFKLLRETELISPQLSETILASHKVSKFLDGIKNLVLPENTQPQAKEPETPGEQRLSGAEAATKFGMRSSSEKIPSVESSPEQTDPRAEDHLIDQVQAYLVRHPERSNDLLSRINSLCSSMKYVK